MEKSSTSMGRFLHMYGFYRENSPDARAKVGFGPLFAKITADVYRVVDGLLHLLGPITVLPARVRVNRSD
jgi:hypothetical protein